MPDQTRKKSTHMNWLIAKLCRLKARMTLTKEQADHIRFPCC